MLHAIAGRALALGAELLGALALVALGATARWWFWPAEGSLVADPGVLTAAAAEAVAVLAARWLWVPGALGWSLVGVWAGWRAARWPRLPPPA